MFISLGQAAVLAAGDGAGDGDAAGAGFTAGAADGAGDGAGVGCEHPVNTEPNNMTSARQMLSNVTLLI